MSAYPVLLIGGSPSSGSTLLMNLLAKSPAMICLPETGLFCHGRNLKGSDESDHRDELSSHVPWVDTRAKLSKSFSWPDEAYDSVVNSHRTAMELVHDQVSPSRDQCIVEKTPENIFALEQYLQLSTSHHAIVTSRDMLSVIQSLMRRHYSALEALMLWFSHGYESARLIKGYPDQVYHCRYSELTMDPMGTISAILQKIPLPCSVDELFSTQATASSLDHMLKYSGWALGNTSWTRRAEGPVMPVDRINMYGMALDAIIDSFAFETKYDGIVGLRELDRCLVGDTDSIRSMESVTYPVDYSSSTPIIQSILHSYPLHRLGIVQC